MGLVRCFAFGAGFALAFVIAFDLLYPAPDLTLEDA